VEKNISIAMERMLPSIKWLFALLVFYSCSRSFLPEEVVISNDTVYIKETKKPLTGFVRTYYANQKPKSVKTYKNGIANGYYLRFYPNGKFSLVMNYVDGKPSGFEQYYENGNIKAKTIDSAEVQFVLRYYENGALQQKERLKNKLLEGPSYTYYSNGNIESIIYYKKGKKHGPFRLYYSTKKLKTECNFVNDSIDGLFKTWTEDGFYGEEYFKMGKRVGVWKYYYPSGKIQSTVTFHDNGLVKERIEYDERGNIIGKFTSNLENI
jgi:antitoxin component YwqK of YwqJK toxin-antitoxin module